MVKPDGTGNIAFRTDSCVLLVSQKGLVIRRRDGDFLADIVKRIILAAGGYASCHDIESVRLVGP